MSDIGGIKGFANVSLCLSPNPTVTCNLSPSESTVCTRGRIGSSRSSTNDACKRLSAVCLGVVRLCERPGTDEVVVCTPAETICFSCFFPVSVLLDSSPVWSQALPFREAEEPPFPELRTSGTPNFCSGSRPWLLCLWRSRVGHLQGLCLGMKRSKYCCLPPLNDPKLDTVASTGSSICLFVCLFLSLQSAPSSFEDTRLPTCEPAAAECLTSQWHQGLCRWPFVDSHAC